MLSVKWKKVEEPVLIQLRKISVLNRYRNKCNWISLTELIYLLTENLETISRLKSRPHPGALSPAFWWLQDEHHSWKLLPKLGEHSGCRAASNQCAQCDTAVLLLTATACATQGTRTLLLSMTTNRGIHIPAVRWTGQAEPAKLKPELGGYGHIQRGKQKTKHMYWRCSKRQLQFKSSSSTNRLQGPHLKVRFL